MGTETPAGAVAWAIPGIGIVAALLLALLLAACSTTTPPPPAPTSTAAGEGDEAVAARPTPTIPPPSPTATDIPTPTSTPVPTNTLLLWTSEQDEARDLVQQLAHEFGSQHAITITVIAKPPATMRIDMQANDLSGYPLPDVLWGSHDDLAELVHDQRLQPIELSTAEQDSFLPAALTNATLDRDIWGYPLTLQNGLLLLFNRAYLSHPPTTTDSLIVQTRAFTERLATQETTTDTSDQTEPNETMPYGLVSAQTEAWWAMAWLNGAGGTVTTPDGQRPTLNTDAMTHTLYLLRELHPATPPDPGPYEGLHPTFRDGQAVLAIDGDWALAYYRAVSDTLALGIAPMPQVAATGRIAASPYGGSYLMLRRSLPNHRQEYAQALATFLTTPTTQLRLAQQLHRLPARTNVLSDTALQDDDTLRVAVEQSTAAVGLPPTPALRCAMQALNTYLPLWLEPSPEEEREAPPATTAPLQPADLQDMMQKSAEQCMIEHSD